MNLGGLTGMNLGGLTGMNPGGLTDMPPSFPNALSQLTQTWVHTGYT